MDQYLGCHEGCLMTCLVLVCPKPLVDLHTKFSGAHPPVGASSFVFTHIFTEKHLCQRSMPPLREVLDPPLKALHFVIVFRLLPPCLSCTTFDALSSSSSLQHLFDVCGIKMCHSHSIAVHVSQCTDQLVVILSIQIQ